jgi:ElaB/YqjD/DUF883 family membrane-anchored ribosome-binding protein
MDDNLLKFFIAATAFAVVLQVLILAGLYLAVRKTTQKLEALATEVHSKALPTMDTVQNFLTDVRPKLDTLTTNLSESSTLVKHQLGRIDATLTDAMDRTRLQVIRADELLSRTMNRVEETSDVVHKTVMSPLRQVNGLMAALSTGVDVFLGQKRRHPKNGAGVPQDEMFI